MRPNVSGLWLRVARSALAVILLSGLPGAALAQEPEWENVSRRNFLNTIHALPENRLAATHVEIVTVGPGTTVTTAFGHSALRVRFGEPYGPEDYYVDFGEYDASFGFLVSLLTGDARFRTNVIPTQSAQEFWDRTGRGMLNSELDLDRREKRVFLEGLARALETMQDGYAYDNYTSNCVTFVRDLIMEATGRTLILPLDPTDASTWRSRVVAFSNENLWLWGNEILLFDYNTDQIRSGPEMIFLADDLTAAVHAAGLVRAQRIDVPHRMSHHTAIRERFARFLDEREMAVFFPPGLNQFNDGPYLARLVVCSFAVLLLVLMIPAGPLVRTRPLAIRAFALWGGIMGLWVSAIAFGTTFQFMDENLLPLVFCPVDFWLWKRPKNAAEIRRRRYYACARIAMVFLALLLSIVWRPQTLTLPVSFALPFFILYLSGPLVRSDRRKTSESSS